jgi:hypothetical protein
MEIRDIIKRREGEKLLIKKVREWNRYMLHSTWYQTKHLLLVEN